MTVAQLIPKPRPIVQSTPAFDVDAATQTLAGQLAATAVERDRDGGHAEHERGQIRDSGLLNLTIPREFGGHGADFSSFYPVLRKLATVDSALAHVFGFHHLQLASIRLFGTRDQQQRLLTDTVQHQLFWGNAANPLDKRTSAQGNAGGYVFHGSKGYSSGSVGSDRLLISGWHEATQSRVIAVVATRHPGVTVAQDWDAFGQKQTDSGTVTFDQVRVPHADVLQGPGVVQTPRATLRTLVSQLILTNLYLGAGPGRV